MLGGLLRAHGGTDTRAPVATVKLEGTLMYSTFKTFAALAIAGIALAHAGSASAASFNRIPDISFRAATPKIVKPNICKNSISRSFGGYTAKKCS